VLIAQITDLHIAEDGNFMRSFVDANQKLAAAVDYLNGLTRQPDVVIATGDLTDHGRPEQYELLAPILEHLRAPLYLIPGNHDEREPFRAAFASTHSYLPENGPIHYTVDGDVRLIAFDTLRDGHHDGEVDAERLQWLDRELSRRPDDATAIFLHHPPFTTGIWWMDCIGLTGAQALRELVLRHPQVRAVFGGHLHRPIITTLGTALLATAPSTTHQTGCNLHPEHAPMMTAEAPMVALHWWNDGAFVSHVTPFEAPPKQIDMSTLMSDWESAKARIKAGPPFSKGGPFG